MKLKRPQAELGVSLMVKNEMLKDLYDEYRERFEGKEIVLGEGNVDSEVMLVGEAPGKDEVRLSRPFVGMAGKNLDEFLEISGIDRASLFITNAIKYRLSKINPKSGNVVNRPASKADIVENAGFLHREIRIINPKYIVTLGNVPLKSVTGDFSASIGSMHGEKKSVKIMGAEYILFPLYHPASIIYNRELKDTYIEDLRKLREVMHDM